PARLGRPSVHPTFTPDLAHRLLSPWRPRRGSPMGPLAVAAMGLPSLAAPLLAALAAGASGLETAKRSRSLPALPGCYMWQPSGCPQRPANVSHPFLWTRDVVGELGFGAGRVRKVCEYYRKISIDKECGTVDVTMLYVPDQRRAGKNATGAPSADSHS
ncbi:unnamed protein product, partial [Prorocentrum cordatum]